MYKSQKNQLRFEDFKSPFGNELNKNNRWVVLANAIDWDELEPLYIKSLASSNLGTPAKPFRVALGALIIKERLRASDEETVEQIKENPYLQYFLGFSSYQYKDPFEASMYVHFRKRIGSEILNEVNEFLAKEALERNRSKRKKNSRNSKDDSDKKDKNNNDSDNKPSSGNQGKLLLDATCAPSDITYPTDLKLLNTAREKTEAIIDILHSCCNSGEKKPRTYRKKARKEFLLASKNKKLTRRKARKFNKKQLNFLRRNLRIISKLSEDVGLLKLSKLQYKNLLVINELYRQQTELHKENKSNIKNRIINIYQPHVRPIMRGKAGCRTEFGAKISVSLIDGFCFLDHLSWEAYNESVILKEHIEKYKTRVGNYPESVHVDKIYMTRANRKYCDEKGIRLSGPALGRPSKESNIVSKIRRQDEIDRIPIEGKFGQGKRRYSLNRIMAKLATTSETVIGMTFLVMNLDRWMKEFCSNYFCTIFNIKKTMLCSVKNIIFAM